MNKISKMKMIVERNSANFMWELASVVYDYEKESLTVDIQYSVSENYFTALVIGRELINVSTYTDGKNY